MAKRYLSDSELRAALGVTRWALFNWRKQGMPHLRLGQTLRYDLDKVIRWAERNAKRTLATR